MSLDFTNLQAIRSILRQEIEPLEKDFEAFKNDVKEIYATLAEKD